MRKYLWAIALSIAIGCVAIFMAPAALDAASRQQTSTANTGQTFVAIRPGASSMIEIIALRLNSDGSAQMTSDYNNDQPSVVEEGTWIDNGDGTITVTLTGRADTGEKYAQPVVIKFTKGEDGKSLQSVDAEDRYGANGLHLREARTVRQDLDRSLFTIDVASGFALDPTFVSVNGGGEVDASLLNPACSGYINRHPIVTVHWTGKADLVRTFFVSDSDSTLVVVTPDRKVLCNDDANRMLLDPSIQIDNPISGTYRIWVGSSAPNQLIPGVLVLTTKPDVTLGTFNLGTLIKRPTMAEPPAQPISDTRQSVIASIEAKIANAPVITATSSPITAEVSVSGTIPLFRLNLDNPLCNGQVNAAPDFVFNWTGPADHLSISFAGASDSTLLVYGAQGAVLACNDDVDPKANINPLVVLSQPPDGHYGVWVGRLNATEPVTGTLTISAGEIVTPTALAPATTK